MKTLFNKLLFSLLFLVIGCTLSNSKSNRILTWQSYFKPCIYVIGKDTLYYQIHLPKRYERHPAERFPLLVFLHGADERGNDNQKQMTFVQKFFSPVYTDQFESIIIVPQCPKGKRWVEVDWKLDSSVSPAQASVPMQLLKSLIFDSVCNYYKVEMTRMYVTGLSMGGFGTWDIICRFPGLFAAALPVCGGGDKEFIRRIRKTQIWAFHGLKDRLIKPKRTLELVNQLEKLKYPIKLTTFPTLGHNAWDSAYKITKPSFLEWMFAQQLK